MLKSKHHPPVNAHTQNGRGRIHQMMTLSKFNRLKTRERKKRFDDKTCWKIKVKLKQRVFLFPFAKLAYRRTPLSLTATVVN